VQPGGGDRLEPLRRRLLQLAGMLAVLLLLVLANAFFDGEEDPLGFNPVAAAAERSQRIPGARYSTYVVYSSPATGRSITATGRGAFNANTERSRSALEMSNPLTGQTLHVVEITDGDFEYLGGDLVEPELPPGKRWVRTEEGEVEEDDNPVDVQGAMQMLCSSGAIQMVGREPIDGRMTRHYRGEIQVAAFVDFLREEDEDEAADAYGGIEALSPTGISTEGWVDGKNLLRRFRLVMPTPGDPGEPPLTVDMRMDIFDYGAQPAIQLPDPGSVVEGPLDGPTSASSFS
jgi:hypothetical protein